MNHRPFEDWLLNDQPLNLDQKRELDAHLLTCVHCTALAETGLALRSARAVAPTAGFAARFQVRLAAQRVAERRRRLWGVIIFVLGGLALLMWLAWPTLLTFIASPARWIAMTVSWSLFLVTTLDALAEAGLVLLRVTPGLLPPLAWMVLISALAGIGLLWVVSIWRFTRRSVPQGV